MPNLVELTASDGRQYDYFGYSAAISGNTAIIGAFLKNLTKGAAYIYVFDGTLWTEQTILTVSDGASRDEFGCSVAILGNIAIVGAPGKNSNRGAAYIYVFDGTSWTEQTILTASDEVPENYFGFSAAISGNTAIVGAPSKNANTGGAYIYVFDGTSWTEHIVSEGVSSDYFGYRVAISGNTAIVGVPGKNSNTGAAYLYVFDGASWIQQPILTASDGTLDDRFGYSVAISGNTVIVGAPGNSKRGAAYIYVFDGTSWIEQDKLTASDGASGDNFGCSTAISGNTAIVGAYGKNVNTGAAYVYVFDGMSWTQQAELTVSDGTQNGQFGNCAAISGNIGIVGAVGKNSFTGAAYIFLASKPPCRGIKLFTFIP